MTQLDDLNAEVASTTADTQKLISDVGTIVTALQAQVAALQGQVGNNVDLTQVTASVRALHDLITQEDTSLTTPVTPPAPPAT